MFLIRVNPISSLDFVLPNIPKGLQERYRIFILEQKKIKTDFNFIKFSFYKFRLKIDCWVKMHVNLYKASHTLLRIFIKCYLYYHFVIFLIIAFIPNLLHKFANCTFNCSISSLALAYKY